MKETKCYKATDSDMCCRGKQFELGVWYKHPLDNPVRCGDSGYHVCDELRGCFKYYSYNGRNRYFKALWRGETATDNSDSKRSVREFMLVEELPADMVALAAVKKNGGALEYVKEQTPEICLEAVKQNGWALKYVEEQTPEICLEAVKRYGGALEYVEEQTPEICLEAVKRDGWALKYVEEQTPEICLEAVKRYGGALEYVEEQTIRKKIKKELKL